MNTLLRSTMLSMVTLVTPFLAGNALAARPYVGLSRTTPGEAYANFPTAKHIENQNNPLSMKLYGGVDLTDRYGIEIGYGFFGTWKVTDPTPGSTNEYHLSSKLLYLAGKASMPLGESFALFGKVGVAANKFSSVVNSQPAGNISFIWPMFGVGASYNFTRNVAAIVEFNHYGTGQGKTQRKAELGLKYAF